MVAALVTTLNEAATIGGLVAALREHVDSVLVVDDFRSTDDTERIAAAFGAATLIPLDATGIGPCLRAGLELLRGQRVVVIDAGGSHNPVAVPRMLEREADVVIGSRFVPGAGYVGSKHRERLSRWYGRCCARRTGKAVTDWTSGFRVYSPRAVGVLLAAKPRSLMHGFQPETLYACLAAGCTVVEHPITYRAGRSSLGVDAAVEAIRVWRRMRCLS